MADYLFEWTAHIVENKRPDGFPREVFVREQYANLPDERVKEFYNERVKMMVSNPGLVVFPNDAETIDSSLTFDQRVYVPWHMITHFHGRVKVLTPSPEASPLDNIVPVDAEPERKQTVH